MLEKVLEPDLEPVLMLGAEAVGDSRGGAGVGGRD